MLSSTNFGRSVFALSISNVISLLGGVALFLFGMSLMGDGLKKVAGNKLELVLYRLPDCFLLRFFAFLLRRGTSSKSGS